MSLNTPLCPRRVAVLGGTGFVGQAFCEHWTRQHQGSASLVIPTRRRGGNHPIRMLPGVEVIAADVFDPVALARVLQGCDALVFLIAILQGSAQRFQQVHVDLPRQVIAACREAGIRKIVHVSALGVDSHTPSNYLRTKAEGEALWRDSGLEVTTLRPSVIFGRGDRLLNTFASLQAIAPVVPLAGADARFQPVWVEDVAHAIGLSLCHPTPPVIECVGPDQRTLADLVRMAGKARGVERPIVPLPHWAATAQALMMECAPGEPLLSRDNLASMQVPNIATGRLPTLESLGISPASLAAIVPTYLSPAAGCAGLEALRRRHRP